MPALRSQGYCISLDRGESGLAGTVSVVGDGALESLTCIRVETADASEFAITWIRGEKLCRKISFGLGAFRTNYVAVALW